MAKKKKAIPGQRINNVLPQRPFIPPHPEHRGSPVKVGNFTIYAGGLRDLRSEDLEGYDYIIPLEPRLPARLGQVVMVLAAPWQDFGPPPVGFETFLRETVIPLLEAGKKILVYCVGSHGRTGTFLASLISILEPENRDPIEAARVRHCRKAVETREQAMSIFALRGEGMPLIYSVEFPLPKPVVKSSQTGTVYPTAASQGQHNFGDV